MDTVFTISKIKAAVFDMDGTLVDSLMLWDLFWSEFGTRYLGDKNFTPSLDDDKKVRTLPLKEAMTVIHQNYHIAESGEELARAATEIMINFYSNTVQLKNGVREFLEYLKNQNVKMCIASASSTELVKLAIKHCNIADYFVQIFSCADIGKGKEEPDVYLQAAGFLGEKIENTCVFEDSLAAIETANKIGMLTVGVYDKFNYGQDTIKRIATEYIGAGETLLKLL